VSDLPDDLREWPDNPYALLGVDYLVDERTARKAYLKLIRRFKPDHYPDHFQRIREAYDSVLGQLSYRAMVESRDEYRDYHSDDAAIRQLEQLAPSNAIHDDAWQDAVEGRERDAYSKLVRIFQRGESVPEACLRLYWLLKVAPELDTSTSPSHWLAEGLIATKLTGPMYELYERELAASPEEAISSRCTKLLEVEAEHGRLYDFVQTRWRACDRLRDYIRITDDLKLFKERLALQHESFWNRLLLLAANHLAWGDEHALRHFGHIKQTLTQSRYLHYELDYELDRLDLLIEITQRADALRYVVEVPYVYVELIEQSWTQSHDRYEPTFERVVATIASDPERGMRHLDHLKQVNQAAAAYLVELIRSHQRIDFYSDSTAAERAKRAAKRFIYGLKKPTYDAARSSLLQASLAEAISPELLARFADELLGNRNHTAWWTAAANSDLGMQGAYHACRLVWG